MFGRGLKMKVKKSITLVYPYTKLVPKLNIFLWAKTISAMKYIQFCEAEHLILAGENTAVSLA